MQLIRSPLLIACSLAAALPILTPPRTSSPPRAQTWKVIAWNDLGMHCMDADYSVFSILPPYNNVEAQVIDPNGKLIKDASGLKVTYEAVVDPGGSINRTSAGKTNYWQYAKTLYGGSTTPDTGLAGHNMPGSSNTPQAMTFDPKTALFRAEGVPMTPYDDGLHKRTYPMMRIVVRDSSNQFLAGTDVVLPVSDEMDCSLCHASGSNPDAKPRKAGWVYNPDHERDYRLNILRTHDERRFFYTTYPDLLKKAGYNEKGLYETARLGTPVLCAKCHASNALPGTGMAGLPQLTTAVHRWHAQVRDPITNQSMDSSTNRAACYRCHPGSETRCLRGAMGGAVAADGSLAMQCQDCHGNLSAVGDANRTGWLDQPNCENCHTGTATKNNGQIRYTSAFDSGKLRQAVDRTFATNKDVPTTGKSLYRFSVGHGGLRCEACHGSTHAVYPSIHPNDNIQNQNHQGHVGTIVECASCHRQTPEVWLDGPHGLHPVGAQWVDWHGDAAQKLGRSACQACHGSNYRGTVLSRAHADRSFNTRFGAKKFFRGAQISCYACHNGPNSESANPNRPPVATNSNTASTADTPVKISLSASDPDNNPLTLRIVSQPMHGRVALSGTTATYHPDPGFAGTDTFTFAAWDGAIDSNLATVSVTRLATSRNYGRGYPGTGGKVPDFTASKPPVLGGSLQLLISNTSGQNSQMLMLVSTERASLRSFLGGVLLTEPLLLALSPLPGQGAQLGFQLPNKAGLLGLGVYAQVLEADAGARFGVAFSRGLELILGR